MSELVDSERLTGQEFRDYYQRPFYTWSKNTDLSRKRTEYEKELDRLSHITESDCNIWPTKYFMNIIGYRRNILVELLKDV